jgi:MerR family transcriptional regulator, light-induced transcriptional regulator
MKLVARRTGLSAHVIRVWERRYGAVTPVRTGTNRRLYSEEDIERLSLLRRLTEAGHNIGNVASLPLPRLRELGVALPAHGSHVGAFVRAAKAKAPAEDPAPGLLRQCLIAVQTLDAEGLKAVLAEAGLVLGNQGLLQRLVAPLAKTLGELWREGTITSAHEHFATAVIRTVLSQAMKPFSASPGMPVLVVATPAGQLHELGALLVAAAASNVGWRVLYLGASLPAPEIAGAVRQSGARAVAVSIVYPEEDQELPGELGRLRELLPAELPLLAGGRASGAYQAALEQIHAIQITDLNDLCQRLDVIRRQAAQSKP